MWTSMSKAFAALGILVVTLSVAPACDAANSQHPDINLPAAKAEVNGALRILDNNGTVAVHYWNQYGDAITWKLEDVKPGTYRVRLNYALPPSMPGGSMLLTVGRHDLKIMAKATEGWTDFQTFDAGVITVDQSGPVKVTLKGDRLPAVSGGVFPDVMWLSLAPAGKEAMPPKAPRSDEGRVETLFDGKSLKGWEGKPEWFRVADGAIYAGSPDLAIPQNEFLSSLQAFGDFELRVKVRLIEGQGNGGVQFRSQRVPGSSEMAGYQADAATPFWGGLYDESRRARFLGDRPNAQAVAAAVNLTGWNDYIIRCEGRRTRIWLNGLLSVDYTEDDPGVPLSGHIGLQIHAGPPSEATYKDIEVQALKSPS